MKKVFGSLIAVALIICMVQGVEAQVIDEDIKSTAQRVLSIPERLISALCGIFHIEDVDRFLNVLTNYRDVHLNAALDTLLISNALALLASCILPVIGPILWIVCYPLVGLPLSACVSIAAILLSAYRMADRSWLW